MPHPSESPYSEFAAAAKPIVLDDAGSHPAAAPQAVAVDKIKTLKAANLSSKDIVEAACVDEALALLILEDEELRKKASWDIVFTLVPRFQSVIVRICADKKILSDLHLHSLKPKVIESPAAFIALLQSNNLGMLSFNRVELCILYAKHQSHLAKYQAQFLLELVPFLTRSSSFNHAAFRALALEKHLTADELYCIADHNESAALAILKDKELLEKISLRRLSILRITHHQLATELSQLDLMPSQAAQGSLKARLDIDIYTPIPKVLEALQHPENMDISPFYLRHFSDKSLEVCLVVLSYPAFAKEFSGYELYKLIEKYGEPVRKLCAEHPALQEKINANAGVMHFKFGDSADKLAHDYQQARNTSDNCKEILKHNEAFAHALLEPACAHMRDYFLLSEVLRRYPSIMAKFEYMPMRAEVVDWTFRIAKEFVLTHLPVSLAFLTTKSLESRVEGDELYQLVTAHGDGIKEILLSNDLFFKRLHAYSLNAKKIPSTDASNNIDVNTKENKLYILGLIFKALGRVELACAYFYEAAMLGHDVAFNALLEAKERLPAQYIVPIARLFTDASRRFYDLHAANTWYLKAFIRNNDTSVIPVLYNYLLQKPDIVRLEDENNFKAIAQHYQSLIAGEEKDALRMSLVNLCILKDKSLVLTYLRQFKADAPLVYLVDNNHSETLQWLAEHHGFELHEMLYLIKHSLRTQKNDYASLLIRHIPNQHLAGLVDLLQDDPMPEAIKDELSGRLQRVAKAWISFLENLQIDLAKYHQHKYIIFSSSFYHQKEALKNELANIQGQLEHDAKRVSGLSEKITDLFSTFINTLIKGGSKRYLGNFLKFIGRYDLPSKIEDKDIARLVNDMVFIANTSNDDIPMPSAYRI